MKVLAIEGLIAPRSDFPNDREWVCHLEEIVAIYRQNDRLNRLFIIFFGLLYGLTPAQGMHYLALARSRTSFLLLKVALPVLYKAASNDPAVHNVLSVFEVCFNAVASMGMSFFF